MSSSKTTTGSNSASGLSSGATSGSTTGSTQAVNPDWVTNGVQGLLGQIQGLGTANPSSYVAPASGNQNQAYGQAATTGSMAPSLFGAAAQTAGSVAGATPQQVTGQTAAGGIGQYLNPFQQSVTNTTLQGLDQANRLALNNVDQGAELSGGYGGSRQGVAQGLTNQLFGQTAASTLAGLNSQNYTSALGASNDDANRAQAAQVSNQGAGLTADGLNLGAAGLLGNLGQQAQSNLSATGATQQGIAQQQAGAPLTVMQQLQQMFSGLPLNLFTGSNTSGTTNGLMSGTTNSTGNNTSTETASNPMGDLGSIAQMAALFA